ncbi:uncharacterized protein TM35_000171850 [Trypanosoma theileri]|uniref:Uncharacterized protein n=1 Tax=Trypanosoma theileri TaxID=67003 RepID=A0A1X0NUZ8_9TRYP|nr:uncharacterized protein TM35_000171850 [Trypanosoma theileri]ORC88313.1 hypothetical protein TM35_000171850 [Trypanosoma theileri]
MQGTDSPPSDETLTVERQYVTPSQSCESASDTGDDMIFKTCLSGKTEGTSISPGSSLSQRTTSRKLYLDQIYNHAQLRAKSTTTESGSEKKARRSDVRGFLETIYGGQQTRRQNSHQQQKESNAHPTEPTENETATTGSTRGTPVRKRGMTGDRDRWASTRHEALEQLRIELEDRLRVDADFRPELRKMDSMESAPFATGRRSQEPVDSSPEQATYRTSTTGRAIKITTNDDEEEEEEEGRLVEEITPSLSPVSEAKMLHDLTIELSVHHDDSKDEEDMSMQRMEEKRKDRRQCLEAKWRAKELKECTFHPCVSPVSTAIFHKSLQEKGNVFDRLYPQHNHEKSQPEEMDSREALVHRELEILSREERESLRKRCGAVTAEEAGDETFELFLHNVLGCNSKDPSVYIQSDYESLLARKLYDEGSTGSTDSIHRKSNREREERQYRLACFDEFLNRQNAHYLNRRRTIQELERALRPSFKPEITENSVLIAKELLSRSSNNSRESGNVSVLASAVKKHRSPYVDPCTFKPEITPVSSALAPRGVEDMMRDSERWRKAKKAAQERALKEEMQHPFRPSLNNDRNAHVESMLNPKNYPRYEQLLRKQRERMNQLKKEKEAKKELEEVEQNTFHPKTTRKPAYVSRMASSFALVRQHYGEL